MDSLVQWMYCRLVAPLAVIMVLLSPAAFAEEHQDKIWLDLTVGSWHEDDTYRYNGQEYEFNSRNFGAGLAWEFQKGIELKGGFADNSYEDLSWYAGLNFKYDLVADPDWFFEPGVFFGLVTGYDEPPQELGTITPMMMATLTAGYKRFRGNIGYVPANLFDSNRTEFAVFQLSYLLR